MSKTKLSPEATQHPISLKKMIWVSKKPEYKYDKHTGQRDFSHWSGQGAYVRSLHGPIGAPKHVPSRDRRAMERPPF